MLAKDIIIMTEDNSVDELSLRLSKLAYQYGWWKKLTIYAAVGFKEVEMSRTSTIFDYNASKLAGVLGPLKNEKI